MNVIAVSLPPMEEYHLIRAKAKDVAFATLVIEEGRAYQRQQGFVQWSDSYPGEAEVRKDVKDGTGYFLLLNGEKAAYVCLDPYGEPAYENLLGKWNTGTPFVVVRRIAFRRAFAGRHLSRYLFRAIDETVLATGITNIRLNTGHENKRMQAALEKSGYKCCGTVVFRGIERVAYDRLLLIEPGSHEDSGAPVHLFHEV